MKNKNYLWIYTKNLRFFLLIYSRYSFNFSNSDLKKNYLVKKNKINLIKNNFSLYILKLDI